MGPRAGLGGWEISPPPGFDPRTVQPVAQSLYRLHYPGPQSGGIAYIFFSSGSNKIRTEDAIVSLRSTRCLMAVQSRVLRPMKPIVFLLARTGFAVEFRHGLISRAGYSTDIVSILHNGKLTQNITKKYIRTQECLLVQGGAAFIHLCLTYPSRPQCFF